ncbi:MAG: hypothetical protein D6726_06670 [Nitrospirae bacterium]|nr:MAG: hypothetical protein D6726_06670 [Nitrospirota bacterium]
MGRERIDKLSARDRQLVEKYKAAVIEAGGKNVLSLVLFGKQLSYNDAPRGRLNFLIILKTFSSEFLYRYSRLMKRFKRVSTPVILTEEMLKTSRHIFPIEFLTIKESYIVIHGNDPLKEINIGFEDLRTEIELQIKRRLIRLEEEFLFSLERKADLERFLTSALIGFVPLFKQILRLLNRQCPLEGTLFREFCDALGLNPEPFFSIWSIKTERQTFKKDAMIRIFEDFIKEMEKLVLNLGNIPPSEACLL